LHPYYVIPEIGIMIVGSIILAFFVQVFFNRESTLKTFVIFSLLTGVICGGISTLATFLEFRYNSQIFMAIKTFIVLGSLTFLIHTFFKLSYLKSIIACSLWTLTIGLGQSLGALIFGLLGLSYIEIKQSIIYGVLMRIVVYLICLIVLFIIRAFKISSKFPTEIRKKTYRIYIMNIIFVVLIMTLNFYYYNTFKGLFSSILPLVINLIVMLSFFVYTMVNLSTFSKLDIKSQELEYQLFYNNTLDSIIGDLRRFKHNYNNNLAVISGYIALKKWEDLSKYTNEIITTSANVSNKDQLLTLNIKNAGVLGVLASKLDYADEKGVDLKIYVADEVSEINMKISDLCEMLGILIDNAIESASESQSKTVRIHISKHRNIISFVIENTTKEKPDINKIFENGYSTKGTGRGLGLFIVNKIINKTKNATLNTYSTEQIFKQELTIM